jgi:hypothetical protein
MSREPQWLCFMACADMASAVVVAEYLRLRECPALAFPMPPNLELGPTAEVRVPLEFLRRAHWFWTLGDDLTDGELEFLATGKLPGAAPEQQRHEDAA